MPELPEVEAVVRRLNLDLKGRSIRSVWIGWKRTVACPHHRKFSSDIRNCKVVEVYRRGKFIVAPLKPRQRGQSLWLLGHLRMSGSLEVVDRRSKKGKHDRVVFELSGGRKLRFRDTRKFGRLYLVSRPEEILGRLGPEPLDPKFSAEELHAKLLGFNARIKPLLLRQDFLAGLGNIYVDETLWRAKIHPERRSDSLTRPEVSRLYRAMRSILRRAIAVQGTDFGDGVIQDGEYLPKVYGRAGSRCRACGESIVRSVVAQRGTHHCPGCQMK